LELLPEIQVTARFRRDLGSDYDGALQEMEPGLVMRVCATDEDTLSTERWQDTNTADLERENS